MTTKSLKDLQSTINSQANNIPDNIRGQNRTILTYLMQGRTLTPLVALTTMSIGSLTKRIAELRGRGYTITSTWKPDANGRWYMSYKLGGDGGSEANKAVKEKSKKVKPSA